MSTAKKPLMVFVAGDGSGAGKSSVALGILACLLKNGFKPEELAYIKPATQCEDIQLVSKWCEANGIAHNGIGPIRFYQGLTREVIDGKHPPASKRLAEVERAVNKIAEGKRFVLVDGVGYPAVGSVIGVSNAHVAKHLDLPVVIVARPGLGNAIDSVNQCMAYFEKFGVKVIGAVWNKIPEKTTYHTFEECRHYVTKYFNQTLPGFGVYGHIPEVPKEAKAQTPSCGGCGSTSGETIACYLRAPKKELNMTEEERAFADRLVDLMAAHLKWQQLLEDVTRYWQQKESGSATAAAN